ncbi:NnrS family protein [Candidatus Magnetaquicoccus inordinatus]|uniref:NnrS family protein n=1 Tax=Candidatus Magnetaquicoccus inordinatus TaxID=2496818 RepID=UPI00102B2A0C|nr:NnrS family protein [Candidatus Magnetaquicoccus inordinatus]
MRISSVSSSILFAYGFRFFFLASALWAIFAVAVWMISLLNINSSLSYHVGAAWHGHEMLYGYISASAAGFLLTATPIWSKKPALSGKHLFQLALIWLVGRMAMLSVGWLPLWLIALAEIIFPLVIVIVITPTLWHTGNKIHRIFPALLSFFLLGDILHYAQELNVIQYSSNVGLFVGIDAIIFFLIMVGGHIMPMFTKTALEENSSGINFSIQPWIEISSSILMIVIMICEIVGKNDSVLGLFFLLLSVIQFIRFSRWHSLKIIRIPILSILHIGYLFLIIGLALRGLSCFNVLLSQSDALHTLTIAAMGLFTVGIMSRVTLTHTGRSLHTDFDYILCLSLILLSSIARVTLYSLSPLTSAMISGCLWIFAFTLFIKMYFAALTNARVDGLPG